MRLNQFLARHTQLSRRSADEAIKATQVTVNGLPATLGQTITQTDQVTLNEQPVAPTAMIYLAFNKPMGYISSRRAQGNSPTLYSLLPPQFKNLKSVGRLDKDSSGLMVLTNDGDLAQKLTHPKYSKIKRYRVELNQPLSPEHAKQLQSAISLDDGPSRLTVAGSGRQLEVSLTEGRNRQVRRTFKALGYQVTKLQRSHFGKLALNELQAGKYRLIRPDEVL